LKLTVKQGSTPMRIIKEEDANTIAKDGVVLALTEKLHRKARAEKIAKREAPKWNGTPLLCMYEVEIASGRKVKRYLPLVQYVPTDRQSKVFYELLEETNPEFMKGISNDTRNA
jgi:hypothetical protein